MHRSNLPPLQSPSSYHHNREATVYLSAATAITFTCAIKVGMIVMFDGMILQEATWGHCKLEQGLGADASVLDCSITLTISL